MDRGARLLQRFNAYKAARDAWTANEFNPDLTHAERQAYENAYFRAQQNLDNILATIRNYTVLNLNTYAQAQAFAACVRHFANDRGNLDRIQIHNAPEESWSAIRRQLESEGLRLQDTVYTFRFQDP